jgi:translation elongation factor EF-Ts
MPRADKIIKKLKENSINLLGKLPSKPISVVTPYTVNDKVRSFMVKAGTNSKVVAYEEVEKGTTRFVIEFLHNNKMTGKKVYFDKKEDAVKAGWRV